MIFLELSAKQPPFRYATRFILAVLALWALMLWTGCTEQPQQNDQPTESSQIAQRRSEAAQQAQAPHPAGKMQQASQAVQPGEQSATHQPKQAAQEATKLTDESQRSDQPSNTSEQEQAGQAAMALAGSDVHHSVAHSTPGLNERVYYADVIVRAKLIESDHKMEEIDTRYGIGHRFVLVFRFEVLEYLKGTGNGELVALATGPGLPVFSTREAAEQLERELKKRGLPLYDTRWDDREAIVFGYEREMAGWPWPGPLYWFGDDYSIDGYRRIWLPSAAPLTGRESDAVASQGMTFLLDPPDVSGVSARSGEGEPVQPRTLSVAALRDLVVETDKVRLAAEKDETHRECLQVRHLWEGHIESYRQAGFVSSRIDFFSDSGLPIRTLIHDGESIPGTTWFEGKDQDLFRYEEGDFLALRPLPAGEYMFHQNHQSPEMISCNYYSDELRTFRLRVVNVTAPEGTLHEAFFDPVAIGSAVGADGVVGVLEPASFESGGGASAAIGGIAWESGKVTMSFSPSPPPADHHVDFIALDGSTALRLDVDDASLASDGGSHTLTWTVCDRPWNPGDKVMLRISQSPPDLTGATNDTTCP